jgi:hypothetical protein
MIKLDQRVLRINKAVFLMACWGLLILLASTINQFFNVPSLDTILVMWAGVTVLGIAGQAVSLVRGLGLNFGTWLAVIAVGWAFTFYVVKFDNGAHNNLFGDLPGVWLLLIGIGHIATAFHVMRRFLAVAGVHFAVGLLMELSAHQVVSISLLDQYSVLVFGIVAGGSMIVAALPVWYRPAQRVPSPAPVAPAPATGGQ